MIPIACILALFAQLGAKPADVDKRVVFLGDSITNKGEYIAYLDAVMRRAGIGKKFEMLNMGLSSETASGLSEKDHPFPRPCVHERLDRVIEKMKPDTIVACYGMNDGIYRPFSAEGFEAYKQGINKLIRKADAVGIKVVLLTPFPFDAVAAGKRKPLAKKDAEDFGFKSVYEDYDDVLARYSEWIMDQGDRVERVIDIRTPLIDHMKERRKVDPDFVLSGDGVHVNDEAHHVVAVAMLKAWEMPSDIVPEKQYLGLVREQNKVLHDAWLAHVGHKRPTRGTPPTLEEALEKASKLEEQIAVAK